MWIDVSVSNKSLLVTHKHQLGVHTAHCE